jgi:hypothetical protein
MTTPIDKLPLEEILNNLSSLDKNFALAVVTQSFSGYFRVLLTEYILENLSRAEITSKWNDIPYSGDISKDVKINNLSVMDRLNLLAIILKQLDITGEAINFMFQPRPAPDVVTLVGSLTQVINDLVNKDHLKIKRKDAQSSLIDLFLPDIIIHSEATDLLKELMTNGTVTHSSSMLDPFSDTYSESTEEVEEEEEVEVYTDMSVYNTSEDVEEVIENLVTDIELPEEEEEEERIEPTMDDIFF